MRVLLLKGRKYGVTRSDQRAGLTTNDNGSTIPASNLEKQMGDSVAVVRKQSVTHVL